MSELLRTIDVARRLSVSTETVLRWHRSGKLPGGRRLASNVLRFDADELEAWIAGTSEGPDAAEKVAPIPETPGPVGYLRVAPIPDHRGGDNAC